MNFLEQLPPGWRFDEAQQALVADFSFADYYRTMAFVNAVAYIAHQQDHHPELQVSYQHCQVRFTTHSARAVTEKDWLCAQQVHACWACAPS